MAIELRFTDNYRISVLTVVMIVFGDLIGNQVLNKMAILKIAT